MKPISTDIDQWIKSLSGGKSRISAELELKLFNAYKNGSNLEKNKAQTELLQYNILPIANIALQVFHSFPTPRKVQIVDLAHVGVKAFLEKLDRYDPSKGRMITFYSRDVKTKMQRFIIKHASSIAQGSVYLQHLASKRTAARKVLEHKLKRNPTKKELAEYMEIPISTLELIDLYTFPSIKSIPGIEYMNVDSGKESVLDHITDILRDKFKFLDDAEFEQLTVGLYMKQDLSEELINKITNHIE